MKTKKLQYALVPVLLLGITFNSFGWGKVGHHIIVDVAKSYVSKSVHDSVTKYLGDMSWGSAATWMDEMRSDKQYDYFKQWHYINVDNGGQYDSTIANGNNVVKQLGVAIINLQNRSKLTPEQINLNIKILFHLMGDLHQPLHVGYGTDRGGNDVKVMYNGKQFSLHRIWDTDIIESKKTTAEDVMGLLSKTPKRKIKKIVRGDIVQWFNQSRESMNVVYSNTDVITEDYIDRCYPIIENQLFDGGVRLGKVLDDIFKK